MQKVTSICGRILSTCSVSLKTPIFNLEHSKTNVKLTTL
jgi:hypothetical protein